VYRGREKYVEVLFGNRKGKIPFGRSRLRWEDNIKTNFQVVERGAWTVLRWLWISTDCGKLRLQ
jgi:hypothetical protein